MTAMEWYITPSNGGYWPKMDLNSASKRISSMIEPFIANYRKATISDTQQLKNYLNQ
jgi:hypothetical protein